MHLSLYLIKVYSHNSTYNNFYIYYNHTLQIIPCAIWQIDYFFVNCLTLSANAYFLALFTILFVTCQLSICSQMFPYYLIFKISIELKMLLCYIMNTKEQSPTRWFDQFNNEIEIPPFHSPKFQGWFFYVELLTKRKNKCKQCQKEQTKSHQILKIKMIFHRHHPHS